LRVMFDLTSNQINLLRADVDGVSRFSSAEIIERYNLNSSANVFRIKEALVKKEVITFDDEEKAHIQDPLFEYWLRNYYFAK
ncbi:MAG: ATPase, partial [Bacteroidales bacterium]|nr:ATPase [Candidatus Cacconaster equifaecalis]